jgi:hypothetical protein
VKIGTTVFAFFQLHMTRLLIIVSGGVLDKILNVA